MICPLRPGTVSRELTRIVANGTSGDPMTRDDGDDGDLSLWFQFG
jgi:hypothetical protein